MCAVGEAALTKLAVEHELDVFFNPRSVAIVGASPREGSIGRAILENMMKRFKGQIFPVNPKYDEILGLKAYPKLTEIPEPVDLAVIAVRAELVPKIMEDAAVKGVKGVIVVSGGSRRSARRERSSRRGL